MRDPLLETGVVNTYAEIKKTRGKDAAEAYWKDMGGDAMFGRAGWSEKFAYEGKEFLNSYRDPYLTTRNIKPTLYRQYGTNTEAGTDIYRGIARERNLRDFGVNDGSVSSLASELRGQSADVNPVSAGSLFQQKPTITPEQGDQMIRYLAAIAQASEAQSAMRPWRKGPPARSASISRNAGIEAP